LGPGQSKNSFRPDDNFFGKLVQQVFMCLCSPLDAVKAGLPDFSWLKTQKPEKMYQMNIKSIKWS
jgi:hypothetical protein